MKKLILSVLLICFAAVASGQMPSQFNGTNVVIRTPTSSDTEFYMDGTFCFQTSTLAPPLLTVIHPVQCHQFITGAELFYYGALTQYGGVLLKSVVLPIIMNSSGNGVMWQNLENTELYLEETLVSYAPVGPKNITVQSVINSNAPKAWTECILQLTGDYGMSINQGMNNMVAWSTSVTCSTAFFP